jgi:hypothetical protein
MWPRDQLLAMDARFVERVEREAPTVAVRATTAHGLPRGTPIGCFRTGRRADAWASRAVDPEQFGGPTAAKLFFVTGLLLIGLPQDCFLAVWAVWARDSPGPRQCVDVELQRALDHRSVAVSAAAIIAHPFIFIIGGYRRPY